MIFFLVLSTQESHTKCPENSEKPKQEKIKTSGIGQFQVKKNRGTSFVFESCLNRENCSIIKLKNIFDYNIHPYGATGRSSGYENPIEFDSNYNIPEGYYFIYSDLSSFEEAIALFKKNQEDKSSDFDGNCLVYHIWATPIKKWVRESSMVASHSYIKSHSFSFNGDMNKAWQFCEKDDECKSVKNKCGNQTPINKSHEKDYLDFLNSKDSARIDCKKETDKKPALVKNKCVDYFCE